MTRLALHPAFKEAEQSGREAAAQIENAARFITWLMEKVHGGSWRFVVDHEVGMVLVRRS